MRILQIFTDGACSGNPGEAAIGVVIEEDGRPVKNISQSIGLATNNVAEYSALVYALQEALMLKADQVIINTDSELIYHQLKGSYKIKSENLKLLHDLVRHLVTGFQKVEIRHVPREQNKRADKLATQAIKKKQANAIAPMFDIGEESPSSEG